jgi:hypothetical protein
MARFLRQVFGFRVTPGRVLILLGLAMVPLLRPPGTEPSPRPAPGFPQVDDGPDEEAVKEFARNPVQYHLIPRLQGRSLAPPSLR